MNLLNLLDSSSYSSSELEEFFHATEVLNSNHRQYSIDALNATHHSSSKSSREKGSGSGRGRGRDGWGALDESSVLTAIKALKSKEVAPLSLLLHRSEEEVSRSQPVNASDH